MPRNDAGDRDPRIPPAEQCVLPQVLERRARELGDKTFAIFDEEHSWSYAEARRQALRTARALRELGVGRGDNVAVCLPNGAACLRVWLGLNYLGAVFAPVNTALRGRILQHVLSNAEARLLVLHADYAAQFADLRPGTVARIVLCGGAADTGLPAEVLPESALDPADGDAVLPDPGLQPWDLQLIHYTSGTSGPSKGVPITYLQLYVMQRGFSRLFGPDDRYLLLFPLFHIGGTDCVAMVIHLGASVVIPPRFRTGEFWPLVRRHGVTFTDLIYSMVSFLLREPARGDDREHTLRTVLIAPLGREAFSFAGRFGVDIFSGFDMTELPPIFVTELNPTQPGLCGRLQEGYQARLVDELDCEVPPGAVGELIVRADCPWVIATGYHRDPAASARAWRNGWFHTGDAFRRDAEGDWYFMGRTRDVLRRRGENISAQELEDEVLAHPGVLECAAIGVPSEHGEEDVLLAVVPKPGTFLAARALIGFLAPRLPPYMIPRYIRIMAVLPKSTTSKIQKQSLRSEGVTPDTFDRDATMEMRWGTAPSVR